MLKENLTKPLTYWQRIKQKSIWGFEKSLNITSSTLSDANPCLGLRLVGLLPCAVWAKSPTTTAKASSSTTLSSVRVAPYSTAPSAQRLTTTTLTNRALLDSTSTTTTQANCEKTTRQCRCNRNQQVVNPTNISVQASTTANQMLLVPLHTTSNGIMPQQHHQPSHHQPHIPHHNYHPPAYHSMTPSPNLNHSNKVSFYILFIYFYKHVMMMIRMRMRMLI